MKIAKLSTSDASSVRQKYKLPMIKTTNRISVFALGNSNEEADRLENKDQKHCKKTVEYVMQ